jgi:hypothetical protein
MSLVCQVNNVDIDLIYSETIEENIISINSKKELFFDVYECVLNNKKLILEKVGESDLGPKVLLEVNIDGKKYSAEAILVDNGSNYVELNKENIYFIRKIPNQKLVKEESFEEENIEPENNSSDNIEINYENIIEHHVNNKLVFLHELEEQFEEKIVSLKDDISDKLDLFFEKLENKKKVIIEEKVEEITLELDEKFKVLKTELHGVEDFSKKNIDTILEKKIKEIDSSVNLFLEGITKEYKNKIISSDKKITHNFLELNSIKDKLKENNSINDKKFKDLNLLKEKLLEQDELVLKNNELLKFINEEFENINDKFSNLSEEESKKYNELLAAINNKDVVEYKTILKEKIQDVELTHIKEALQEDITNALQGDIVALKRYVEMSSGGGTVAKQYARGGTMDGDLNVTGNFLSGGQNLLDVFATEDPPGLQDVTNIGNTTTNLISSNNTIIANTIKADNILSATNLDIGFELSGFNVTGNISASGGLSAANINVSGDILPSETTTFNIGSSASRFKDIFLAGDTIHLSGTKISTDSDGDIEFRDSNNLTKRIKASELVLESTNDPNNDIVFKVDSQGNPEFQKRRRLNPNIIEPSVTISDIVSAVQVRVRGNVGIGTNSERLPNKPLTVIGDISATNTITSLAGHFTDAVGIGTTTPTHAFDIKDVFSADGTMRAMIERTTSGQVSVDLKNTVTKFRQIVDGNAAYKIFDGNNAATRFTIDSSGNVGIGRTDPSKLLDIKDGDFRISSTEPKIFLNDTNNNSDFSIKNNNGNFHISDTTNGPTRLAIDSIGRVGIGTTSPNEALTVVGDISASNNLITPALSTEGIDAKFTDNVTIAGDLDIGFPNENEDQCIVIHGRNSSGKRTELKQDGSTFSISPQVGNQTLILGSGSNNITCMCGNASHELRIPNKVTIGTTGGAEKLTVSGNISANGSLSAAKIVIGTNNTSTGILATVAGGCSNLATGNSSFVGGGVQNCALGNESSVGGGQYVRACGNRSVAVGGYSNCATGFQSFVGGGNTNKACGSNSTVAGGSLNTAKKIHSFVGGGYYNYNNGNYGVIGGGIGNGINAAGNYSVVGGGNGNVTQGNNSAIVAGHYNRACAACSFIGGGGQLYKGNITRGIFSSIVGGRENMTCGTFSFIGGGECVKVLSAHDFIGGGFSNTTAGSAAVVVGGRNNRAFGLTSSVVAGSANDNFGLFSSILGGCSNRISPGHDSSFIIGTSLSSNAACTTFVNNLSTPGAIDSCSITSSDGYKVGGGSIISCSTSFTPALSDNGRTILINTSSDTVTVTFTPKISGYSARFIKEDGAGPVVFSAGTGLSGLYSYQDRDQMSIIYAQADIFYKNENIAFLGGNLQ